MPPLQGTPKAWGHPTAPTLPALGSAAPTYTDYTWKGKDHAGVNPQPRNMGDLGEPSTGQAAECCGLRVLAVSSPLVTAPLEGDTSRHPCRVCSWDLEGSGCRAAPLASPLINMQQKMQDEKRTRSNSLLLSSPFLTLILPAHKPRATK